MKSLLLTAASFFIISSAHAMVLPTAGFVAQQCGPQTIDTAHKDTRVMQAACVGYIGQSTERAVEFTLSDDSTYLFRVVGQNNLMMALQSGATMSTFKLVGEDGKEMMMKAIINRDGTIKSVSGEFQTNSYLVPAFKQVFSMQ